MCVSPKPSYLSTNPPFPSTYLLIVLPKFLVTSLFHPSHPPWQKKMEWVNTCPSMACNKKSLLHNNDKVNSCNRSNRLNSMMSSVLLECGPNYAQASTLGVLSGRTCTIFPMIPSRYHGKKGTKSWGNSKNRMVALGGHSVFWIGPWTAKGKMTCVRCSLITLEKWAQVFAVRRQAAKQFISPTEPTHCTIEHLWRGGELTIQTIMWHIDRENHVHNQPKLIGRNTNKMWELCYKCLLQIGLQKGSLASYSYHLCRPKSKCNLQLSLWAGPSPPPHFTILLFQNKGKKKRGKKGLFLQRCL